MFYLYQLLHAVIWNIDIGNPQMPKQVVLLEESGDLALNLATSIEIIPKTAHML